MSKKTDEWRRERMQALVEKFSSKAALGRALGYKDGAFVRQMIDGERPITEKTVEAVHQLTGCSGWFEKALGHEQTGKVQKFSHSDEVSSDLLKLESTERIPEYETGGRMGASGLVLRDQPGEIRGWEVTKEWLRKNVPNCTSHKNLAIVTGFGDSMRPLYNPGDPLLIDTGVVTVEYDAIYFFRVGDEGFIKRLQRIPGNGLVAISENPSYRDWTITSDMDFQVFGRVVKIWRGDDF